MGKTFLENLIIPNFIDEIIEYFCTSWPLSLNKILNNDENLKRHIGNTKW
jgi:hypothetical protein